MTSLNVRSNAAQAPRGGSSNQLAFGSWQSGIVDRVGLADSKRYRVAIWRIYVGRSIVGGLAVQYRVALPQSVPALILMFSRSWQAFGASVGSGAIGDALKLEDRDGGRDIIWHVNIPLILSASPFCGYHLF